MRQHSIVTLLGACLFGCSPASERPPASQSPADNYSVASASPQTGTAPLSAATGTVPAPPASGPLPLAQVEHNSPDDDTIAHAPGPLSIASVSKCEGGDWSPQKLPLLLRPTGKKAAKGSHSIIMSEGHRMRDILGNTSPCEDAPRLPVVPQLPLSRDLDNGVRVTLRRATEAGRTGRDWRGHRCEYELELIDGSSKVVILDERQVPPFNSIYAVLRNGSAVYVGIQFNGYAKEFPKGGCAVIAADLCDGTVKWRSKNYTSNGDLALVDNRYLVTGYGFTAEKRILQIHESHSGRVLQTLTLAGNPESLEFNEGLLTVQTNHGPNAFELME